MNRKVKPITTENDAGGNGHNKLMTATDLGKRWERSPLTILRDARLGRLPAIRLGARTVRFSLADVLAFEAAMRR